MSARKIDKPIGPTGRPGRMGANDAGSFRLSIGIDMANDRIKMEFGTPMEWIGMTANEAENLGRSLYAKATTLRRMKSLPASGNGD